MEGKKDDAQECSYLALMQLADSAFPTGAFSHSFGLETAVQEKRIHRPSDLYGWLLDYLSGSLAPMEGTAAYWAYRYVKECDASDRRDKLIPLDKRLALSRLSFEARAGGIKIGKRYLRTIRELYPGAELAAYEQWIQAGQCYGNSSIVHGWIGAYLQQPVYDVVLTHLYAGINGLLQNALRVMGLGQTNAQKILLQLLPAIKREARRIEDQPLFPEDMHASSPLREIEEMRHETLYSRLFMS